MLRTFLTAASIVAFVTVAPARAQQGAATTASGSPDATAQGGEYSRGAAMAAPADNQSDIVDYRLNQGLDPDLGELSPNASGFSGALTNVGPLQGLRFRFHAMRLVDKAYLLDGGSGVGRPQYATTKHFVLSISKQF